MLLRSLVFLVSASASAFAQQIVYDVAHNTTPIEGTWSSGSMNVTTGTTYANPNNKTFSYPTNTGQSFTNEATMWFEVLRFRMYSNGSYPNCPTIVLNWSHGTFQLASNGSILFTPVGDGYQQIQDPCAARSDFVEDYNDTELYQSWQIFTDPTDGPKLHMFAFDGSPEPPMRLLSAMPNMYPNQRLTNASQSPTT
ncbi:chaperone for protein-folding within the ER, fungal-domain-containing protein, partial [Russula compacta]